MTIGSQLYGLFETYLSGQLTGGDLYDLCTEVVRKGDLAPTPLEEWALIPVANRIADWYTDNSYGPISYHHLSLIHCTMQMLKKRISATSEWLTEVSYPDLAADIDVPGRVARAYPTIDPYAPVQIRITHLLRAVSIHRSTLLRWSKSKNMSSYILSIVCRYPDLMQVELDAMNLFSRLSRNERVDNREFLKIAQRLVPLVGH